MHILLKEGKLKKLILEALEKAESYKELARTLGICRQKIWYYQTKNVAIKEGRLDKILKYLGKKIMPKDIEKRLPDNWRQIKGGRNCVTIKIKNGTLNKQLRNSRNSIKNNLSDWHRRMKKVNPEEYHITQYNHFKKVGNYKFTTIRGEKVRNLLEKEVADILKNANILYEYEPLVKGSNKYFFPDFLIRDKKVIIECTMWRGYDKAIKLAEKIKHLEKEYKIYVIIPEKLSKYYGSIKEDLVLGIKNFKDLILRF